MTLGELWTAVLKMLGHGVRGTSALFEAYEEVTTGGLDAVKGIKAELAIERARNIEALTNA